MQTWPETGDTGGIMRFDTIIRNGTIVTATDTYAGDVGITNGLITAIGKDLPIENADKIIDAKDGLVIPGGIDVHTHFDLPFGGTFASDDFQTGSIAALQPSTPKTSLFPNSAAPSSTASFGALPLFVA